jgi:hypothetical protein
MFCPDCGAESTQGLNYCKRCGAILTVNQPRLRTIPPIIPLSFVSMVGLIGLFGTLIALANTKIDERILLGVAFFGGATLFGVISLLIWLSRHQSVNQPASPDSDNRRQTLHGSSSQQQLNAPPLVVSSVTDHTTRNIDARSHRQDARE